MGVCTNSQIPLILVIVACAALGLVAPAWSEEPFPVEGPSREAQVDDTQEVEQRPAAASSSARRRSEVLSFVTEDGGLVLTNRPDNYKVPVEGDGLVPVLIVPDLTPQFIESLKQRAIPEETAQQQWLQTFTVPTSDGSNALYHNGIPVSKEPPQPTGPQGTTPFADASYQRSTVIGNAKTIHEVIERSKWIANTMDIPESEKDRLNRAFLAYDLLDPVEPDKYADGIKGILTELASSENLGIRSITEGLLKNILAQEGMRPIQSTAPEAWIAESQITPFPQAGDETLHDDSHINLTMSSIGSSVLEIILGIIYLLIFLGVWWFFCLVLGYVLRYVLFYCHRRLYATCDVLLGRRMAEHLLGKNNIFVRPLGEYLLGKNSIFLRPLGELLFGKKGQEKTFEHTGSSSSHDASGSARAHAEPSGNSGKSTEEEQGGQGQESDGGESHEWEDGAPEEEEGEDDFDADDDNEEEENEEEDEDAGNRESHSGRANRTWANRETEYAQVLGLNGRMTREDIRSAYRKVAQQYHPDKVRHLGPKLREVAEMEMRKINEAYEFFRSKYGIR